MDPSLGRGGVHQHNLAGDQPVEQHPLGRELLFQFTSGAECQLAHLYIGGDIERPDCGQRQAALIAPGEETAASSRISPASVRIADIGGEAATTQAGAFTR
jgi:hypothetical protein